MNQPLFRALFAGLLMTVVVAGCKTTTEPTTTPTTTRTNKQSIIGSVKDAASGAAIANAIVTLSQPDSSTVISDAAGLFRIDSVPPGTYILYTRATGYAMTSQSVRLDSGANTSVAVTLGATSNKVVTLTIHVRDAQTGVAMPGAEVLIANDPPGFNLLIDSHADNNGDLTYVHDSAGWYYFEAVASGYTSTVDSVFIALGQSVEATQHMVKNPVTPPINYNDSLVAVWRFANNFLDSSSHGHDGTRHGGTFVADRFGNPASALSLNGTTDYVTIPDAADLNFGRGESFTITMWLNFSYPPNTGKNSYLFYKGNVTGTNFTGYRGYVNGYDETGSDIGTTYGEAGYTGGAAGGDGRWHLFAFKFDRDGWIGYSYDASGYSETNRQFMNGNVNTTAPLELGGNGVTGNQFKGKIDDVRIYRGVLPPSYLDSLYHEYGW